MEGRQVSKRWFSSTSPKSGTIRIHPPCQSSEPGTSRGCSPRANQRKARLSGHFGFPPTPPPERGNSSNPQNATHHLQKTHPFLTSGPGEGWALHRCSQLQRQNHVRELVKQADPRSAPTEGPTPRPKIWLFTNGPRGFLVMLKLETHCFNTVSPLTWRPQKTYRLAVGSETTGASVHALLGPQMASCHPKRGAELGQAPRSAPRLPHRARGRTGPASLGPRGPEGLPAP